MSPTDIRDLLQGVQAGHIPAEKAVEQLTPLLGAPSVLTDNAHLDLDRSRRCGFPEVIFAEGKTPDVLLEILRALHQQGEAVLATRVSAEQAGLVRQHFPEAIHNVLARTIRLPADRQEALPTSAGKKPPGKVAVITAGTSDRPVAEEALETLRWMNCPVELIVDVGVAGPHRLPEHRERFADAAAVVVVAGMEGALPSVVGGWVNCPVFAVPTSVGYGASFGGLSALLGMLNSCAANVAVVNIDAGFKAAYLAGLVARNR